MRKRVKTWELGVGIKRTQWWNSLKAVGKSITYFQITSPRERALDRSITQLLSSMQMKDMLEAYEAIKVNRYNMEPLMEVTSEKAQEYANYVNQFERDPGTRHKADKMKCMLNDRILDVNAKSVDRKAAEKFYKSFMDAGAAH